MGATLSSQLYESQLKAATGRDRIALYARYGIWYDALTLLDQFKFTNPSDRIYTTDWVELLQSVGLNNIAKETTVQQYTPK